MEFLNSLSWTILSFVFVLGIMIFIHELGHHLMAKFLGIRVDVFSLGFGPRLFGFRKGDTDYRVSLLPLGGFVKMKGENYDDDLKGDRDEFLSRPKLHRFLVAVAGPAMNIGLAVVLLAATYMVGIQVPAYLSEPPVVEHVSPESPAADAGIQEGDQILSIAGTEMATWEDLQLTVATNPGQILDVQIRREGEVFNKQVAVEEQGNSGTGYIGALPEVRSVITAVADGPAKSAGLQAGDVIAEARAGETRATDLAGVLELISENGGSPITFTIRRGDQALVEEITPVQGEDKSIIGISIVQVPNSSTRTERYAVIEAFQRSIQRNYQLTLLTFDIVGKLVTGATSLKMMSGPIEIARFSGQAASQGALALSGFMALISLQLGIFNLFPIPILDGGVIALLLIEGLMGRDLSLQVKERIFQVGFIFLILLMSIVIFNDIAKNI